eukprot:Pgem_evm1s1699
MIITTISTIFPLSFIVKSVSLEAKSALTSLSNRGRNEESENNSSYSDGSAGGKKHRLTRSLSGMTGGSPSLSPGSNGGGNSVSARSSMLSPTPPMSRSASRSSNNSLTNSCSSDSIALAAIEKVLLKSLWKLLTTQDYNFGENNIKVMPFKTCMDLFNKCVVDLQEKPIPLKSDLMEQVYFFGNVSEILFGETEKIQDFHSKYPFMGQTDWSEVILNGFFNMIVARIGDLFTNDMRAAFGKRMSEVTYKLSKVGRFSKAVRAIAHSKRPRSFVSNINNKNSNRASALVGLTSSEDSDGSANSDDSSFMEIEGEGLDGRIDVVGDFDIDTTSNSDGDSNNDNTSDFYRRRSDDNNGNVIMEMENKKQPSLKRGSSTKQMNRSSLNVSLASEQKPETRNQKPETKNHKPQTTNHKPQTTNHKPQTTTKNHKLS